MPTYKEGAGTDNGRYTLQVRTDLINGMLASIGLNSDDVHLFPGTDPKNSKLFFVERKEDQVNAVVSQFGSKPRFQIQPISWYRGVQVASMPAVYEVWIKTAFKEKWPPVLYAVVLAMFWTVPGILGLKSPINI